jgi:putative endonuclease
MPYFVYVLQSIKTGKYYIGYTRNLEKRLKQHNGGRTKSLIKHIPLEIIRVEEYKFYEEARKREKEIKKYKSGEAFKKIINSVIPPMAGC